MRLFIAQCKTNKLIERALMPSKSTAVASFQNILTFWFKTIEPKQWWIKSDAFDQRIFEEFSEVHSQAIQCELAHWRSCIQGRLAEIIVLDQFSRNLYRNSAQAFANDSLAVALAQEALLQDTSVLQNHELAFLYMPFMHSESATIHQSSLELFQQLGLQQQLEFEIQHKAIIDRFGRYPHRNTILGRTSTAEEIEFLQTKGSRF